MTITQILELTLEELQGMDVQKLEEIAETLATSKQKKASRKLDLVNAILKQKADETKSEPKEESKEEEGAKETIENSTKKATPKVKAPKKATPRATKATPKVQAKKEEPKAEEKAETKKETPKVAPKSLKKPEEEKILSPEELSKMSQQELLTYIQNLQKKVEKFPQVLEASKVNYIRTEFDTIADIQKFLLDNPYQLYMYVDENYSDGKLTCFIVLYVSSEVLVMLDLNRERNSTITLNIDQITSTHLTFPKDKAKFAYSFYIKKAKEEQQADKEEKAG